MRFKSVYCVYSNALMATAVYQASLNNQIVFLDLRASSGDVVTPNDLAHRRWTLQRALTTTKSGSRWLLRICVTSIPYSWYNVTVQNNNVNLRYGVGFATLTNVVLEPGIYDIFSLAAELQRLIRAIQSGGEFQFPNFAVTANATSGRLSIRNPAGDAGGTLQFLGPGDPNESSASAVLGLTGPTRDGTVNPRPFPAAVNLDLRGTLIYVRSLNLHTDSWVARAPTASDRSTFTYSDILAVIPLSGTRRFSDIQVDLSSQGCILRETQLSVIDFRLTDREGNSFDFQGDSDWKFRISLQQVDVDPVNFDPNPPKRLQLV